MKGPHANAEPVGSGGNQSRVSDQALRRMEMERRREQDLSDRDREIESLWRQIKELELEMRGWHRRRDYDHGSASGHIGGSSH
nr:hypothetical protein CFP56_25038 [Quercus suber]